MHDLSFADACDGRDVGTPESMRMPSLPLYSLDDPDPWYSDADILPAHAVPGTKRRRDDKDGSAGEELVTESCAAKRHTERPVLALPQQKQADFADERTALQKALEEQLALQAQAFSEERTALKRALEEQLAQAFSEVRAVQEGTGWPFSKRSKRSWRRPSPRSALR
eukprot:gene12633-biopygen9062